MKFLCVTCDQPMKLTRTHSADEGALSVVFACNTCGREVAMLTNPMETQMVRSLGVKIGGRTAPPEPMEMVRRSLGSTMDISAGDEATDATNSAAEPVSKCPFSGVVEDTLARHAGEAPLVWTPAAESRIERIPEFARPMVRKGVEMHARERGYTRVDDAVIEEVKDRFGM